MSFDPKCYDLAQAFLEDTEELKNSFGIAEVTEAMICETAQAIQDAIEDKLQGFKMDRERERRTNA